MLEEQIDIFNDEGIPLGACGKTTAHENGFWHKTDHLWCHYQQSIFLSRRSNSKQWMPSLIDSFSAGHRRANETRTESLSRETLEETGLSLQVCDARFIGVRVSSSTSENIVNNEFQYIHVAEIENIKNFISPSSEVSDFVAVNVTALMSLLQGNRKNISANQLTLEDGVITSSPISIRQTDFFPSNDNYFLGMCEYVKYSHIISDSKFCAGLNIVDVIEINDQENFEKYLASTTTVTIEYQLNLIQKNHKFKELFFKSMMRCSLDLSPFNSLLVRIMEENSELIQLGISIIGWNRSSNSLKMLEELIYHPKIQIRADAVFVLGEVGGLEVLNQLSKKLTDEESVAKAAAFSLGWNQGAKRKAVLEEGLARCIKQENAKWIRKALSMIVET